MIMLNSQSTQPRAVRMLGKVSLPKRKHHLARGLLLFMVTACGCVAAPPPAPATLGIGGAVPPAPMTLPRYLGIETVTHGFRRTVYRGRLFVSHYLPALEPLPPGAHPVALGDPQCLQSPAPSVAAAAAIQQADAAAPAKIQAIQFLSKVDCANNPQVEEALLAGMNDPVEGVRSAAVQAVIDGMSRCGNCSSCATNCGGCCTQAIHSELYRLAFMKNDQGCYCEPSPHVRRLARLALNACACPTPAITSPVPEELPAPEVIQQASKG